jgi:FKBP-type peptidyl-prolyl cis-trans isomerase
MRILSALVLAGGLAIGVGALSMTARADDPPTPPKSDAPATQPPKMDDATKKQLQDAVKKAMEKQGATTTPPAGLKTDSPPAAESKKVPSDLPVVKTVPAEGGLVIEELKIGTGPEIQPGGMGVVNYHGTLKEGGAMFDSTYDASANHVQPFAVPLDRMIEGWKKGVPGMKVGGVRRLTVPYAMAYGEAGQPPKIPAKADLVFIVELLDVLSSEDTKVGDGDEASGQAVAVTAFTMKDADGKVVESATKEKPYIWFPNEIGGVSAGIDGMKVGGKRTIHIPKDFNQGPPQLAGGHTLNVPATMEVELLAVRNIPGSVPKSQKK